MIPPKPNTVFTTIVLAGLGREGYSSYHYFVTRYPNVAWILSDDLEVEKIGSQWQELIDQAKVRFVPLRELANLESTLEATSTLIIKTAGIPLEKPGIQAFLEAGASLTSNTAAFFAACNELPLPPRTIGVTGTKGKSTTSTMIYHVLKQNGLPAVLAGNIGVPPLETLTDPALTKIDATEPAVVILELSSHQLRELTVSPEIAVVQDITPEHLDYYATFESYVAAKSSISRFQKPQDWVVFNPSFEVPARMANESPAQKLTFSLDRKDSSTKVYVKDEWLWFEEQKVIALTDIPLMGRHNVLNTMPAVLIAAALFSLTVEEIASAIRSFVGLPHRLEFAGEVNGLRFYNDSQATTPEATMAALASFPGKSITLLAGGSDKGVSFDQLGASILESNVARMLVFPPMGEKIVAAVESAASAHPNSMLPQVESVQSMPEAVKRAAASAPPDSIVLLSPACASFGLFKNYQDRGDQFKAAVAALKLH